MTPADLAAAPNLAAYLCLLNDNGDFDDEGLDALDSAWAALSSSERETVHALASNPAELDAAVAHVRAMLAVEPKENES